MQAGGHEFVSVCRYTPLGCFWAARSHPAWLSSILVHRYSLLRTGTPMTRSVSLKLAETSPAPPPPIDTNPDYVQPGRKPPCLRVNPPAGPTYSQLRETIDNHRLHTVCESAKCPNM